MERERSGREVNGVSVEEWRRLVKERVMAVVAIETVKEGRIISHHFFML